MKDVTKTCILVGIVLLAMIIILFVVGNIKYGTQLLTRNTLAENDPSIKLLMEQIDKTNGLRRASLDNNDLNSEEIIKFTLENATAEEYTEKNIKAKKISCEVTGAITFSVDEGSKCVIRTISNDLFYQYQKRYFGLENEITFNEIDYHGMKCKNDGDNYYCLINEYKDNIINYSLFKSAYSEKDKIVIQEYYLRVDLDDKDRCLKYFDGNYCDNYNTMDKPDLDKEMLLKNGILYEHVFKDNGDNYYLEKSYIVSER